jgi:hypothetical protein
MNFLTKLSLKSYFVLFLLFANFYSLFAQEITLTQDPKIEQLLAEKRKVNASITINNQYKIQIYNGSSEESKKILIQFKKENKVYDATIVFSTPIYKVWIGNFKSRIEAERNLNLLKKKYPSAILIKPNK